MANGDSAAVLRHVRTLFGAGAAGGLSDGQLLERFRRGGNHPDPDAEAAFAVLVARHGPMVFGVCRRALRDPNDAADAFQAAFLVLVRKAGSVRGDDSLGRWLYGVSRRVAAKARATRARRLTREGDEPGREPIAPGTPEEAERRELFAALDEEVSRLPEPFRSAVVLCDLGGWTQDAAAQQFGCPVGTVESRLYRGRQRLRERLTRRGLAPTLIGPAGFAPPAVPEALSISTARAAARAATVSAAVSTLIERVITDMAWTRIKTLALGLGAITIASAVGITAAQRLKAEDSPRSTTAPENPRDALALALQPPPPDEPDAGNWVGQRVVTKLGAVLSDRPQYGDDSARTGKSRVPEPRHLTIYRVEEAKGPWLSLVAESDGLRAWVLVSQVVPLDQAIDYFTGVIKNNPKQGVAYRWRGSLWLHQQAYERAMADLDEAIRLDPLDSRAFVARGATWSGRGDQDKGIADLNEAIRLDPKDAWAYGNRASCWWFKSHFDTAIADYNEAIRLDPADRSPYAGRGDSWQAKGDFDRAVADYTVLIRLDPKDSSAYVARGDAWRAKGESEKAIADYGEAISIDPQGSAAFTGRGQSWQAKGEHAKAIADCDEAIPLDPHQARTYAGRGQVLLQNGESDKAIADFNEAIRLDPKDAQAYSFRGQAWRAKGEHDKAIADFNEAIRIDPAYDNAYCHRGDAWLSKDELDKAIADYTEAIRLRASSSAYNNRGTALIRKEQHDQAIADFTEAIRLEPGNTAAYVNRGTAWAEKGEHDKAIVDCNEAIRMDPAKASAYYTRAGAWRSKGEYDKAIADYTETMRLDPTDVHVTYVDRSRVWRDKEVYDKAIADCNEAIRSEPNFAEAYNERASAYWDQGEHNKSIADYTAAIRNEPKVAFRYVNRGLTWKAMREYHKALADFSEAIRIDPGFADAYDQCAVICAACPDARHRDGKRAVEAATHGLRLTEGKDAGVLGTLAAAHAESGDFDAAVRWQEQALELVGDEAARREARAHLALYRAKKPYRDHPEAK
jgi:RNA polymerase sigma factor (sigma-70 family)